MQNAFCSRNVILALDFGETVEIKTVLSQNDAKRIWQQKRRFGIRFSERVQSLQDLSKKYVQIHFPLKRSFWH